MPAQIMLLVVLCGYMAFLAWTTPFSIDDYRYVTYPQDGFREFVRNNIDHYLVLNGRTYVHWLLELDLYGPRWIFPVVSVVIMLLTPFLLWKINRLITRRRILDRGGRTPVDGLSCLLLFSGLFLFMPPFMKTDGVLWQSGYFNYIFPMPVLLYMLFLLAQTETKKERHRPAPSRTAWIVLICFLAGTSTEQYGSVALCITVYFFFRCLFLKRNYLFCSVLSVVGTVAGLLVILLAPSMRDRMYRENVFSETVSNMFALFRSQAELFTKNVFNMILLTAAIATVCFLYFVVKKEEWITVGFNLSMLALSWLMYINGDDWLAFLFSLIALAASGIRLLLMKELRSAFPGILLSSGLVSVIMVLPSKSFGSRLIVPLYLFLSLVLIFCVLDFPFMSFGLQIGFFLLATVLMKITYPHYLYNYKIEMKNEAFLKEMKTTHELWYDVDYDKEFTRDKIDRGSIYLQGYLKMAGFQPGTDRLYLFSKESPGVFYNGQRISWYAKKIDGSWWLPVRYLIEAAGGTVGWNSETFSLEIQLNEVSYHYSRETLRWHDAEGDHRIHIKDTKPDYEVSYFPQSVFKEAFGIQAELTTDVPERISQT